MLYNNVLNSDVFQIRELLIEMSIVLQIVTAEILYFLAIASGIWLSHTGKPLNPAILIIHLFFGMGAVIFTSFVFWNLVQEQTITTGILVLSICLAALILGLVASGILLTFDRGNNNQILRTHNITTILGIIVSSITIYLLSSNSI
jgi:hypothetical protein